MGFRITGLDPARFSHLFGLDDYALAEHRALRLVAGPGSGMPDRVRLRDAEEGESVLLVNHEHQPAATPFRASHAVYVVEGAEAAATFDDEIPPSMAGRLLSIRAFDADGMMIDADVAEGSLAGQLIERLLADDRAAYLHAHYARMGCFAALVERRG